MPRKKMNRENIIRMAQEAGLVNWEATAYANELSDFAALVASAEREACAKLCEEIYTGEEACGDWPTPEMCATAIRARGQA